MLCTVHAELQTESPAIEREYRAVQNSIDHELARLFTPYPCRTTKWWTVPRYVGVPLVISVSEDAENAADDIPGKRDCSPADGNDLCAVEHTAEDSGLTWRPLIHCLPFTKPRARLLPLWKGRPFAHYNFSMNRLSELIHGNDVGELPPDRDDPYARPGGDCKSYQPA